MLYNANYGGYTPKRTRIVLMQEGKIACEMYLLDRYREIDFPAVIVKTLTHMGKKTVVGPLRAGAFPIGHWLTVS